MTLCGKHDVSSRGYAVATAESTVTVAKGLTSAGNDFINPPSGSSLDSV